MLHTPSREGFVFSSLPISGPQTLLEAVKEDASDAMQGAEAPHQVQCCCVARQGFLLNPNRKPRPWKTALGSLSP